MMIMYDFPKIVKYRKEKTDAGERPIVKIASGIKEFDKERASLYQAPRVSGRGMSCAYSFVFPVTKGDMLTEETLDIDEFIAAMWRHGIRFGLSIPNIQEVLEQKKTGAQSIAQGRNCVP